MMDSFTQLDSMVYFLQERQDHMDKQIWETLRYSV